MRNNKGNHVLANYEDAPQLEPWAFEAIQLLVTAIISTVERIVLRDEIIGSPVLGVYNLAVRKAYFDWHATMLSNSSDFPDIDDEQFWYLAELYQPEGEFLISQLLEVCNAH